MTLVGYFEEQLKLLYEKHLSKEDCQIAFILYSVLLPLLPSHGRVVISDVYSVPATKNMVLSLAPIFPGVSYRGPSEGA